jgi:hypothetical protein
MGVAATGARRKQAVGVSYNRNARSMLHTDA